MNRSTSAKIIVAAALLGWAGYRMARHFSADAVEKAFFYDQSAGELFAAERDAIPPIAGTDNDQADAVRAVVISPAGRPRDRSTWEVAYLETCAPELKQQMEAARSSGEPLALSRGLAGSFRFVRRLSETNWHRQGTPEAEKIVSEWLTAGPNGSPAAICQP